MCKHTKLCFFGEYPTLHDIANAFEKNTPVIWLIPQLSDLSEYCGCKDKLEGYSLRQCAELIADNYGFLKITEVMLFFYRFKLAKYGGFYGSIDPLIIMGALKEFMRERNDEYFKHDQQEREKQEADNKQYSISWEEYCKKNNIQNRENPLTKIYSNEKSNY